ncbi:magnesium-translocating P-type ATPase [Spiroplasma endosymbiont of Othius punctulatus]|uniref:magnesium-translocating P-type ATPase n=1 Tax=Spiroplasma endosymbiont of Othius punctulatus TaxID=3066289 RepID=UPI0030D07797
MNKKKNRNFNKSDNLTKFTNLSNEEMLRELEMTSFGLSEEQVHSIEKEFGNNETKKTRFNWFLVLSKLLFNPFNIILIIIDVYNFYSYFANGYNLFDLISAIIVLAMVFIACLIGFLQEFKTHLILKKMFVENVQHAKVVRNTNLQLTNISNANSIELIRGYHQIDKEDLVRGDLLYITNGDIIPADLKIVWQNDLYVDQQSLTGETFPVPKQTFNKHTNYLEYSDICYTGTIVTSGSALALVVSTGENTYFSSISQKVKEKRELSSFEKGISRISLLLLAFMLVVTPFVFLVAGLRLDDWVAGVIFAISAAVGITPEMLPIIVTSNLSQGYKKIKSDKLVVKNLNSIQNLGAIDILCTDKTGTITSGEIKLSKVIDYRGGPSEFVENILYLNSYFQTGFANPIDRAILTNKELRRPNIDEYQKSWEIPFSFERKILSVVVEKNGQKEIIAKGALDEVLEICSYSIEDGKKVKLTKEFIEKIRNKYEELGKNGYRCVGIAHNVLGDEHVEKGLTFYGLASFFDEPKSTSEKLIKSLKKLGVETKILTGDNEIITRAICRKVNFKVEKLVTGADIDRTSDEDLKFIVEESNVFVKLSPLHKAKIIQVLKSTGHVVGFMGDGINDAPVLRASDIAISFADASNIAQDASDMILMTEDLMSIEQGVVQGRIALCNILKYIKLTVASNFGNVISLIVGLFLLTFTPMQPVHLLLQNLLFDITQFATILDKVDETAVDKPKRLESKNLAWFAIINGSVSSLFDILTFVILLFAFNIGRGEMAPHDPMALQFNASWFVIGLMTQACVVHVFRTEKIPFVQSTASWPVIVSSIIVIAFAFIIPYTGINSFVLMAQPDILFIPVAIAIVVVYVICAQLAKMLYIKLFKSWL